MSPTKIASKIAARKASSKVCRTAFCGSLAALAALMLSGVAYAHGNGRDRDDRRDRTDREEPEEHDAHRGRDYRWDRANGDRFVFLVQPSLRGTAGQDLLVSPVAIVVNRSGRPSFDSLRDVRIAAYVDSSCSTGASGRTTGEASRLLSGLGIAAFRDVSHTLAGALYFKISARGVQSVCSRRVEIEAAAPDHLIAVGGNGQSGAAGAVLPQPAQVRVVDGYGNVVAGARISFAPASGGGSASPAIAVSGDNGVASTSLKLGLLPGPNTWIAASASGRLRGRPSTITFSATVLGGQASRLALMGPGSNQAGACSSPFRVSVTDSSGQLVNQGNALAVSVAGLGGGVLYSDPLCSQALTSVIVPAGASSVAFYLKDIRAESLSVVASAEGLSTSQVVAHTVSAAAPSSIQVVAGNGQSATVGTALPVALQVRVEDAFGNRVSGAGVSFAVTSGGGSVSPASTATDANGVASASMTLGTVSGSQSVRFSGQGAMWVAAPAIGEFLQTALPGAPSVLTLSGPQTSIAGSCSNVYVASIQDSHGNPASASSPLSIGLSGQGHGSFYADPQCSQRIGAVVIPVGAGFQDFYLSNTTAESVTVALDGSAAGLNSLSQPMVVAPASADHLVLVAGDGQSGIVGTVLPVAPQVRVVDLYGNGVSGVSLSFAVTGGGGIVGSDLVSSDASGLASTSYKLGAVPGANSLLVSRAGGQLPGTPATLIVGATAQPTPPVALVLSGPVSQLAGDCSGAFTVSLRDAQGDITSAGSETTVGLSQAGEGAFYLDSACGGVAVGSVGIAAHQSSVSFYFKGSKAENLLLAASSAGLSGSTLPYTVQAGAAAVLAFGVQPSGAAVAGQALQVQPQVLVKDIHGNVVGGGSYRVELAAFSDSGCSAPASGVFGAQPVDAVSGTAVFEGVSYTSAHQIYLGASSGPLTGACSTAVEVSAAAAASLAAVQGEGQSGVVGTLLPIDPTVKATDAFGNVVSGEAVLFSVTTGDGTVSVASGGTDESGLASAQFTLGLTPGINVVTVSLASGAASVEFAATGTTPAPVALLLTGPSTLVAGACSGPYAVQLMDSSNSATVAQVDTQVALTGAGQGSFFEDAGCSQAVSSVAVAQGQGSVAVFVADPVAESLVLVAQAAGLGSSSASASVAAAAASALVFSGQPSSSGTAAQALAAQPVVSAHDAFGNLDVTFASEVTLAAFADAACSTPAFGSVAASSNPVAAISGQASFSGVSYSAPGIVYLRASSGGLAPACSQAITVASSMLLAAGTAHTCALKDGGVKCWGFNSAGSLGTGNNVNASTPQQVVGLASGVLAMGAGGQHGCAALSTGVACWGLNASGQLGNGSTSNSNVPVPVANLGGGVTQIVGGDTHTCVLSAGTVKCWGANDFGQLGNGGFAQSLVPVAVQGLPGVVRSIAAASVSSCAVLTDGRAFCWGSNSYGQLGDGSIITSPTPVQVHASLGSIDSIAPGIENTCALVGGAVYCWGHNNFGQLGSGSSADSMLPQPVLGLNAGVTRLLSGGQNFSCAILASGAVRCWGQNTRGQLGDNRASGSSSNVPVQVVGLLSGYQVLHAGYIHACASNGSSIQCWGWGSSGQLGNGATSQSNVPVNVVGY